MAVTSELLGKIKFYEGKGYTPDEIVQGIKASGKYQDVAAKIDKYSGEGYGMDEVLAGIKQSPVASSDGRTPSYDNRVTDRAEIERKQKEFLKGEGTLGSRLRNTSGADMAKNALYELPRLAQEVVTVPLSSAKKGAYGIGALAKTGGALIRGKSVDEALQTGTEAMSGYTPIQWPLEPSMVGEATGYGIEKGINAAENATGNTGFAGAGIQAGADILGLVGGGKVLAKSAKTGARSLKDLGNATRPASTELQTLSRQHNVPLTAGEELSSPNLKQVEARLERLPGLGIRGFRKKQADSLAQGAQNLADEFATVVEDPATALADRYKSNLKKAKEESSAAYKQIDEALAENGDPGAIEPVTTRTQLKGLLAKSPDIFERLPGSQNRLKSIMSEIAGDTAPKKINIPVADEFGTIPAPKAHGHGAQPPQKVLLGADGKPITRQTSPKLTYEDYTWLRSQLGEYIDRAHSSAGAVGSNELRQLTIIKKALDADFYRWGKNSGYENVTAAVDNARNVYKTKVAPFENVPVLKSIVNDKFTPEQLLDSIAKPGQATLAFRAMKGLKPSDKVLVQDAIMRRAIALGYEGAKDGAPISAAKFATFFEKMDTRTKNAAQSPLDVFFSPAEKQRVMGFAKLARAAERASQYSANPLTGVAAADFAIPGALATMFGTVGAPAAAGAAAFTKTMSVLLSSEKGKALLHRAYRTPAGATAAWQSIMQGLSKIMKDQRGLAGKDIDARRTPHFKKWFGDWESAKESGYHKLSYTGEKYLRSKVVDDNYEPLVVYHGGPAGLKTLDASLGGVKNMKSGKSDHDLGTFFTTDKGEAGFYSRGGHYNAGKEKGKVYEAYLNIRSPYTIRDTKLLTKSKEELIQMGFDGLRISRGDIEWFVPFSKEQIRLKK